MKKQKKKSKHSTSVAGKSKKKIKQKIPGTNFAILNVADSKNSKRGKVKDLEGGHKSSNSNLVGAAEHTFRNVDTPNADPTRTHLNNDIFNIPVSSATEALERAKSIIGDASVKNQFNGDKKVICDDILLTTSPEYWIRDDLGKVDYDNAENKERLKNWVIANKKHIKQYFDVDNIVYANLQLDETTPHIALMVVNKGADGTINRKKFGLGDRKNFTLFKNDYYKKMQKLDLKKPVEKKKKRTDVQTIEDFKANLNLDTNYIISDISESIDIEPLPLTSISPKARKEHADKQAEIVHKTILEHPAIQQLHHKAIESERNAKRAENEAERVEQLHKKAKKVISEKNKTIKQKDKKIADNNEKIKKLTGENNTLKSDLKDENMLVNALTNVLEKLHKIAPKPFKVKIEELAHWIKFSGSDDSGANKITNKTKVKFKK